MKLFVLFLLPASVVGHACLVSPASRQWFAHEEGLAEWQQRDGPLGYPRPESNQYGYQAGGYVHGPCGKLRKDEGKDYTHDYVDVFGNPVPWYTQATYVEGDVIEIEVKVTANHRGHFEFRVCAEWDEFPTQECFDENLLTFVEDLDEDSPFDERYPERGYIRPGVEYVRQRYKLPAGISGQEVLLQWQWISMLGCAPIGYDTVDWPESWGMGTWWGNLCELRYPGISYDENGKLLPSDGNTPQHYWQCAEVTITPADGDFPVVTPAPIVPTPETASPTQSPVVSPTASPTTEPSDKPSKAPVPTPSEDACWSNNWKTCNLDGVAQSCDAIYLPDGPEENDCVVLWGLECSSSTCCGGATCFEDGTGNSQCIFADDSDPAPAPEPEPAPAPAPECGVCTDAPGENQPECNNNDYEECSRKMSQEGKCAWIACE